METVSPPINIVTPLAGPAMKAAGALIAGILAGAHLQINGLIVLLLSVTAVVFLILFWLRFHYGGVSSRNWCVLD